MASISSFNLCQNNRYNNSLNCFIFGPKIFTALFVILKKIEFTNIFFIWQNIFNSITILYLGLPLNEIDHPAITICSQGLIQDIVDNAVIKQFDDYRKEFNDFNITHAEILKTLYPGSQTSPQSLARIMMASDPEQAIAAQVKRLKMSDLQKASQIF